ncbi:MAG: hypothetical protein K2X87_09565 [Gemmataceae bacterium]|nr:hypothetical protein [Gemmataceae bacterium]
MSWLNPLAWLRRSLTARLFQSLGLYTPPAAEARAAVNSPKNDGPECLSPAA